MIAILAKVKKDLKWEGWEEFLKWQYRTIHMHFDKRFNGWNWEWITSFARVNNDWFACKALGHYEYFIMCPSEYFIALLLRLVSPFYILFMYVDLFIFKFRYIWVNDLFNWAEIPKWLEIDRARQKRIQETIKKVEERKRILQKSANTIINKRKGGKANASIK